MINIIALSLITIGVILLVVANTIAYFGLYREHKHHMALMKDIHNLTNDMIDHQRKVNTTNNNNSLTNTPNTSLYTQQP